MRDEFDEEHDFSRKERKTLRKMASRLDRSKYKKTDQEKTQQAPIPDTVGLKRGIVISVHSQGVVVDSEGKTFLCTLRGALKKEVSKARNLVIVGDYVLFEDVGSGDGSIVHIEERKSVLSRKESLTQQKEHFIAANVDQVCITVSVVNPLLRPTIIDRYLIAAEKGNLAPVIICNKIDLLQDPTLDPTIRAQEQELVLTCKEVYEKLGIRFLETSVSSGVGIDTLRAVMHNKITLFSGQSGTGKSSLINVTCNHNLPIAETVHRTKKGAHTTSFAQLLTVPGGGFCVDTPGIKSFGVWNITAQELRALFAEIFEASRHCRFPDCQHIGETGCAIPEAITRGEVSQIRYDSYCNILESIGKEHLRR